MLQDDPRFLAAIEHEKRLCAADPCYYIFNHVRTIDPLDSEHPVKQFPDTEAMQYLVREVLHGGEPIEYIIKSRQIMMSWVCVAYISWLCRFHPYAYCYIQSKKEPDAREMLYNADPNRGRLNLIEQNLPWWLRDQYVVDRNPLRFMTGEVKFAASSGNYPNGSVVTALAQGPSQIEGHVPRFFFSDESSLQPLWLATMGAIKPTIQKDAKLVCVGTSRPPGDFNEEMEACFDQDDLGTNIPTKEGWKEVMTGVYKYRSRSGASAHGIHYSSDPAKDPMTRDGVQWLLRMSSFYDGGTESVAWLQHMEMDFAAVGGTLLIPFLRSHMQYLTCPPIPISQQLGWRYYAGFDYGKRNLTAFGVHAVTPEGMRYTVWELAKSGKDLGGVPGIAEKMRECPYWDQVKHNIRADPSIWNESQAKDKGGYTSIAQLLRLQGVSLQKAPVKGNEADAIAAERLLHHYWADPEEPGYQIFSTCQVHLRQWAKLRYREWAPIAGENKAPQEELVDKDNDTWDAWKYAECARTAPEIVARKAPPGSFDAVRKRTLQSLREPDGRARAPVASPSNLGVR